MKILIVEDNPTLNRNILEALSAENIKGESVFDGLIAERLLMRDTFDCIIMDINLPGKNGFDLCKDFRKYNNDAPVLMLTAFGDLEDKVKGFDCGADDYLTKPFFMRELLLRVNSLVKRSHGKVPKHNMPIVVDDIAIYTPQKKVIRGGKEIALTPREYQILLKLCEHKGEIVSKNELIKEIWGTYVNVNTNTIEVYVNFLRNKIDKPFNKNNIKTKVGYGYYIDLECV